MNPTHNNLEFQDKNIIIVEDDIPSVKYYVTLLMNSGANITVFTNGKDFLEHLESSPGKIDLLIIDFLIPFVNGIECVRIFRKERKDVPVLMLTAYFSEHSRKEAMIAGCNEYVLKPVFPEKINFLIQKYLKPQTTNISVF